ncbi:hypothetical protein SteCoe_37066 [Stentor coeruleus]|uniref:Uncharacterized protein n=1 Tax=Stentor coeruleus TaxID=5963 RepID=A0A1R2ANT5_9CILI|nr:hypothetical protein SteCoe_37066 [Stentor coeruleus]
MDRISDCENLPDDYDEMIFGFCSFVMIVSGIFALGYQFCAFFMNYESGNSCLYMLRPIIWICTGIIGFYWNKKTLRTLLCTMVILCLISCVIDYYYALKIFIYSIYNLLFDDINDGGRYTTYCLMI